MLKLLFFPHASSSNSEENSSVSFDAESGCSRRVKRSKCEWAQDCHCLTVLFCYFFLTPRQQEGLTSFFCVSRPDLSLERTLELVLLHGCCGNQSHILFFGCLWEEQQSQLLLCHHAVVTCRHRSRCEQGPFGDCGTFHGLLLIFRTPVSAYHLRWFVAQVVITQEVIPEYRTGTFLGSASVLCEN